MTIGDVLAYLGFIVATIWTLWAAILVAGLVFTEKTRRAANNLESAPGKAVGIGVGLAAVGIGIGLILVNSKNGLLMFVGWVFLALTLCIAMIGSAGLAQIVSERMRNLSPDQGNLALRARAGALLIGAGLLPAVGWALLFPLQLFACLGAGFQALTARKRAAYEQPTIQTQTNQQ